MPNYYRNRLTLRNASEERINEVLAAIGSKERPVIDFNKIIPMPEPFRDKDHDDMVAAAVLSMIDRAIPLNMNDWAKYVIDEHRKSPDDLRKEREEEARQALRNIADYGYMSFYRWANDNWGTKWNSMGDEKEMYRIGTTLVFETANGYCKPVVAELSRRYPDVTFAYMAADEDIGACTIFGDFKAGKFKGREEHRTNAAFEIAFKLYPEERKNYRLNHYGVWEYIGE